jgi:hypothetical protein
MNGIADIVRAIGHQQGEYAYYRACYSLFKQLQDLVAEVAEDLNGLYESQQCNPSEGFLAVSQHLRPRKECPTGIGHPMFVQQTTDKL